MNDQQAYDQGVADCANGVYDGARRLELIDCRHLIPAYFKGWDDQSSWESEASLRYVESGAAYEAYLDSMSEPFTQAEIEYFAWQDFHRAEFGNPNPEAHYVTDPFMALVFANGEEAEREADRAWQAGEPDRKAAARAAWRAWKDAIPF